MTSKDKFLKGKQTALRRSSMDCKVYELKVVLNQLNLVQLDFLKRTFLEAKWVYNHMIASDDIFHIDGKLKQVNVLNKDKELENRNLIVLSAQVKQELIKRIHASIKSLSTKKKKGRKKEVGRLKFKSEVNSVPLKQYGISYKFDFIHNTLKLSGLKKPLKVKGLEQISNISNVEFANANLIKKRDDYYLKVTTFQHKINREKSIFHEKKTAVGLDFGIATDLTLSNGLKFNTKLEIPRNIRLAHRKISRRTKGGKNYTKAKDQLKSAYEKHANKKIDAKNKIVSYLKNNYDFIAVQNENIKGWHAGLYGKQVQQSIMGGIISEVKKLQQTTIVDRWFPSSKLCWRCGTINNDLTLIDRTFTCNCGCQESDRDVHAAENTLVKALIDAGHATLEINRASGHNEIVSLETNMHAGRMLTPVEFNTSVLVNLRETFKGTFVSVNVETGRRND